MARPFRNWRCCRTLRPWRSAVARKTLCHKRSTHSVFSTPYFAAGTLLRAPPPERLWLAGIAAREQIRRLGVRVAPGGLRADRPGVDGAVAECAYWLTVVCIGRRRQGNRAGRDADNYRSKDHVIHRSRPREPTSRKGRIRDGKAAFLDGFLTQPSRWPASQTYSGFPRFLAGSFRAAYCSLAASPARRSSHSPLTRRPCLETWPRCLGSLRPRSTPLSTLGPVLP